MFVADKLIYLQMEKTASTHIARVLGELIGGEQLTQHVHLTRDGVGGRLPIDTAGRLVIGSMRNPWSWYLSLWAYGCRGGGGRFGTLSRLTAPPPSYRDIAVATFRRGRATRRWPAEEVQLLRLERARQRRVRTHLWRPLYDDADDVEAFRTWMRMVYAPQSAHELFPEFGATPMHHYAGFMTFRYFWNFSSERGRLGEIGVVDNFDQLGAFEARGMLIDDMVTVERLEPDLRRVLATAGYALDAAQNAHLHELCATKTNESPHRSDREYFDDELIAAVAARERYLVERYALAPPW